MAATSEAVQAAISREVFKAMQPYRSGDEFIEPIGMLVVQAAVAEQISG